MRYLWAYWFPFALVIGWTLHGRLEFLSLFTLLIFHPVFDQILPRIRSSRVGSSFAESALLLYPLVQTALFILALYWIRQGKFDTLFAYWLFSFSFGVTAGGIGITVAHELIHRSKKWQRHLGTLLLSEVFYAHFTLEHVVTHHTWVATPRDPATARRGEWLQLFWLRSIFTGYADAWRLDRPRRYRHMIPAHFLQIGWGVLSYFVAGWPGVGFFIFQALTAISLLETINYVEHYGLERKRVAGTERFEPIRTHHSWDSNHYLTNTFLFNLGFHSDHHLHPRKPFSDLSAPNVGPSLLPIGYAGMLLLALVPPIFFKLMHPQLARLEASVPNDVANTKSS